MGDDSIFKRAFKREMGKNTGKVLSNFLFGDSWSTPYRASKIKGENDRLKIDREQRRKDNAQVYQVDAAVLKNIDKVASFRLSHNKEELLDQMAELTIQLSANKYHDVSEGDNQEAKVRNKFNDALMEKYKQALIILKTIAPTEPMLAYYKKAYKKAKRSKLWNKYKILYLILIMMFVCVLLIASAS